MVWKPIFTQLQRSKVLLAYYTLKFATTNEMDMSKLLKNEFLGGGSFSSVFSGSYKLKDGSVVPVAIKILRPEVIEHDASILYEGQLLKSLSHPSIITCYGWHMDMSEDLNNSTVNIVLELCDTTLRHIIQNKSWDNMKTIKAISEIASGMEFMHSKGLMHRDLKPENVFVKNDKIKIADVGLAKYMKDSMGTIAGTSHYMAPEVVHHCYNKKADVYSFGLILWELWYKQTSPPIEQRSKEGLKLMEPFPNEPHSTLIQSCSKIEPHKRPTFTRIVKQLQ